MDSGKRTVMLGWLALLLITPIYYFANLQKVIIPGAAFDELQQLFSLDAEGVTRLGAVFLGVYAAAQLVVGVLADRFGGARVIIAGGAVFCIGSVLSAFTSSLPLLYFCRFLSGAGAASIYLCMVKEIGRVGGNMMPMLIGIATIIGYSGSITGASPFIAGVDKFGYFNMVFWTGIATFAAYSIYVMVACKEGFIPVNKEVKFNLSSYLAVGKSRQNCALMIAIGISFGTYFALQSTVGKKFLEDFCGLSGEHAGLVMTVTMIIAALNGFVMANVSRLIGNRRMPVIWFSGFGCCIGALMIFAGIWLKSSPVLPISGIILMAFAGNISPIYVALIKESNEDYRFGTAVCVGNCFAYAVSALFGWLAGKLMDVFDPQIVDNVKLYGRDSYLLVFGVLALLGLISAVLTLTVKESKGKNIAASLR